MPTEKRKIYTVGDLPENERDDPGDKTLQAEAIKFVRENQRSDYRQMQKDGELDEYARLKAKATREYAENLIAQGEMGAHAWRRAMRVHIYEREED
jgi:hypothetical protein